VAVSQVCSLPSSLTVYYLSPHSNLGSPDAFDDLYHYLNFDSDFAVLAGFPRLDAGLIVAVTAVAVRFPQVSVCVP